MHTAYIQPLSLGRSTGSVIQLPARQAPCTTHKMYQAGRCLCEGRGAFTSVDRSSDVQKVGETLSDRSKTKPSQR
eukprot:753535-Hanusia_phi.AAC.1